MLHAIGVIHITELQSADNELAKKLSVDRWASTLAGAAGMSWHGLFAVAERMGPERMLAAKSANPENATMKSIISGDSVIAAAYRDAEPRQFGTLHERMKWLIEAIQNGKSEISSDVREAVHELEAEIKHHVPAKPPFSKHT